MGRERGERGRGGERERVKNDTSCRVKDGELDDG